MKINIIKKTSYGKTWYSWTSYCDACGKQFKTNGSFNTSEEPDDKKDFCLCCLNYALDNNIPKENIVDAIQSVKGNV